MALGLGVLRLAPADLWAMTPRELAAAIEGVAGRNARPPPLGRERLAQLMATFPDEIGPHHQEKHNHG
ncbi:MAG: phage tail assembly chaperone [Chelatococcus sp.]|nr:phage tail assembly chaperone [Chelatococcus sp.]CAH1669543.1 conserved hypothetical protein [Hyphomicrobiales bacterium]CAH1679008.1 conserved hypothetical protein [Hyphomicrobiales bacterium]